MISLKKVFSSDNWIIINVIQGFGTYRVDAKERFTQKRFSKWGKKSYIKKLCLERFNKNPEQLNSFRY